MAAAAAAGVEPCGRLSSEDGDAAADRVAVVRLWRNRKLLYKVDAAACRSVMYGASPTCQIVSLGGAREGAALLLPRLAAGERRLRRH